MRQSDLFKIVATLAFAACGPSAAEVQAKQDARLCSIAQDEAMRADRRANSRTAPDKAIEDRVRAEAENRALAEGAGDMVKVARGDAAVAKERLRVYRDVATEERAFAAANVARRTGMTAAEIDESYARTGCLRP